jgi:hypothetical protein
MEYNNIKKINIHDLDNNLSRTLWAFVKLTKEGKNRFWQTEIANFLVDENVNIKKQAIDVSLKSKKAKDFFNKNKDGFKIMDKGYSYLLNQKSDSVWYFESGEEYNTKRKEIKKIFEKTVGNISICDPYIDLNTLDLISNIFFKEKNKIRILTKKIPKKEEFDRQIDILKKDG